MPRRVHVCQPMHTQQEEEHTQEEHRATAAPQKWVGVPCGSTQAPQQPYLVEKVLLRHEMFLEHILVEIVGRADTPLHTASRHLFGRSGKGRTTRWKGGWSSDGSVLVHARLRAGHMCERTQGTNTET